VSAAAFIQDLGTLVAIVAVCSNFTVRGRTVRWLALTSRWKSVSSSQSKCSPSAHPANRNAASFGNSAKGPEHAPDFISLDMNISKQFKLTESRYVLLRSEFFNLPNHPSFSPPARNISAPATFGAITGTSVGSRTTNVPVFSDP